MYLVSNIFIQQGHIKWIKSNSKDMSNVKKTGVMMLKIQLCITGINYILKYSKVENSYLKL